MPGPLPHYRPSFPEDFLAEFRRLVAARTARAHLPVHASWLNQVEVYFALLQRKVLTPNDSTDLQELELRIRLYEELTNKQPKPFDWTFTKYDLFNLLQRLARREVATPAKAPGATAGSG